MPGWGRHTQAAWDILNFFSNSSFLQPMGALCSQSRCTLLSPHSDPASEDWGCVCTVCNLGNPFPFCRGPPFPFSKAQILGVPPGI